MKKIHLSICERPDVPASWEIHIAPRPLTGTEVFSCDFGFVSAIDPFDECASLWKRQNEDDAAVLAVYHSMYEAVDFVKALCEKEGYGFEEFCENYEPMTYFLDHLNGKHGEKAA